MKNIICKICGKNFLVPNNREKNAKYCSYICFHKSIKGRISPMKGRKHSIETRIKMSIERKGEKNPNFGKKFSFEHRRNISLAMKSKSFDYIKTKFKKGEHMGENHPNWKGGTYIASDGSKLILNRNHPFANKQGYLYEHRIIAEKYLGRYLTKKEIIHHINLNKLDNNPENLYLFPHQNAHRHFHTKLKKNLVTINYLESNITHHQ